MKAIIQDPQLDDELQELYILSNHWISDIHFAEDEVRFFKNVLNKYRATTTGDERLNEIENLNNALTQQDADIYELKNNIGELLKFIGSLIVESNSGIRIDLIEKFANLEVEMKTLFESVKQVKKLVFSFTEEEMRIECQALLNQID